MPEYVELQVTSNYSFLRSANYKDLAALGEDLLLILLPDAPDERFDVELRQVVALPGLAKSADVSRPWEL